MTNSNKNIFQQEIDNSGLMKDHVNDVLNKLSILAKNFDIVKNNSDKLEIRQNNLQHKNAITITFNDI